MDIKNLAVQVMALKTKAEMADKSGNAQQKREVLEQMRTLAKQVMDSEDPGRFVLLVSVYGMFKTRCSHCEIKGFLVAVIVHQAVDEAAHKRISASDTVDDVGDAVFP